MRGDSCALGSLFRGGLTLTLDAQLVAFRLADAVVGGNGDILHILDLRDTRVRRCALVFVGAHADLVDDGPIVVLIHTALLEALVHTELVVTVILNSLGQVLDSLFRSLTRVHAKVLLKRVALSMDVRGCHTSEQIEQALHQLDEQGIEYEILFIDAPDDVLMRRYSETRRRHPISIAEGISTREALAKERQILQPFRERADYTINTEFLSTVLPFIEL